jgi:hypothetical protein
VKLDADTLPTVPAAPPAAGPDRALDAVPPDRGPPTPAPGDDGCAAVDVGGDAETEGEEAVRPTESPMARQTTTAAVGIHTRFLLASSRRSGGWRP